MKKSIVEKYGYLCSLALVLAVAYILLLADYSQVMRKTELLNIFLPGGSFFVSCLERPGGLIEWAAAYLTQFFYHPWLGAAVFAILLAALQWLAVSAMRIRPEYRASSAIVPAMVLLGYVALGYLIFSIKSVGIAFASMLGVMAALLMYWGYASIKNAWLKALAMVITALLYPLFGAYALFATLLCIANAIAGYFTSEKSARLPIAIGVAASVALLVFWPWWWLRHAESTLYSQYTYLAALPRYNGDEWAMWLPYAVIAAYLLWAAIDSACGKAAKRAYAWSLGACVLAIAAVLVFRCDDRNFKATVAIENALDDCDFQKAAKIALDIDFEPTRLNVMLGEIALNRTGQAADRMFALENGSAPYNTTRSGRALHDAGSYVVAFNVGRLNYAYRWAMEYLVENGIKVDYLKYMVRCALINGERELAKKNLDVLSQTMNHRRWASKYYAMLDDMEAVKADPELGPVGALAQFKNYLNLDQGMYERYLRPTLAGTDGGTWAMLDLSLQNCLANKEVSKFLTRMPYYASQQPRLPRHYQEAIVLGDRVKHADVSSNYQIDPAIKAAFQQFVKLNVEYQNLPEDEQRARMKPIFGDTYWYYFVYVKDITQI